MTVQGAASEATWAEILGGRHGPRFLMVLLGIWLTAVDSLVTSTIMPTVGEDLGGFAMFGWAIAAFFVGVVLASASAGRLSEIFGLRRATVLSAFIFAAGCGVSTLAGDMPAFLVGRLVQGIGSGWIAGFAMVTVGVLFPERHMPRVFASITAVWGVAIVLGPLLGGVFAETGNWRGVFLFFAVQALAFAALAHSLLRSEVAIRKGATIPWLQLAVLAVAIGSAALANVAENPLVAIVLTAAGLGTCGGLLLVERTSAGALLPRSALDWAGRVGPGYLAMFALTASSTGFLAYGPAIIQKLHNLSPLWAGYVVAIQALAWILCSFAVSGTQFGSEGRWIRLGGVIVCAGLALLAAWTSTQPLLMFVVAAAVMGAGFGLCSSLMNRRVLVLLPHDERPTGSSALIATRQAGGAFGAAIAGTAANLSGFGAELTHQSAVTAGTWVFMAALPFALIGAWAAWKMAGD